MIIGPPRRPELILDSSVLAKWFRPEDAASTAAARQLRREYQRGLFSIVVPALLYLEILNIAARKWRWSSRRVSALAGRLATYGFTRDEPPLARIAFWAGKGLTAYDACYLALAEHRKALLVTADQEIQEIGGRWVRPL